MNNSVIDLIIRIKNGYLAGKEIIEISYSKLNLEVLKKLEELEYIKKTEVKGTDVSVVLLYKDSMPALTDIKIFSKPGNRNYVSYNKLKLVMGGLGQSVLSTSMGILTNREARRLKVGGELLFSIW